MFLKRAEYLTTLHFNGTISPQEQEELSLLVLQLKDEELQQLLGAAWNNHVPNCSMPDDAAEDMLKSFFKEPSVENRSAMALHVATGDVKDENSLPMAVAESTPVIKMQAAEKKRSIFPLMMKLGTVAAAVLVVIFFAVKSSGSNNSSKPLVKTFSAAAGERKNFQLPDGSVVSLNSGSSITISEQYAVNTRDIYLQGEAFFDVKHNKNLPFIVHTNAMDVRAVGTAFNVKAYPGEKLTEAALVRGAVEVTLKQEQNRKLMLSPNEKVQWKIPAAGTKKLSEPTTESAPNATPAQVIQLTKTDDGDIKEIAWKENKLVFTDESFADIAVLLERWYGVKISFADTVTSSYHFTGVFEREELESVLGILKESRHFNYTITPGEIIKVKLYK